MKMRKLDTLGFALATWGFGAVTIVACEGTDQTPQDETSTTTTGSSSSSGGADTEVADSSTGSEKLDLPDPTGDNPQCATDGSCQLIDILFVIDNSGTMGEEQLNLARNFQFLVQELQNLTDADGQPVDPNVNIMVTTTDFGHPLCTAFQKPDYVPRQGAPVYQGCNSRIQRFTGLDPMDPEVIEEACTENCPADVAPGNHFINFSAFGSNVPDDDVGAALSCIGPQGIDGCGYEAQLEIVLQAINADACWNNPEQPKCDEDPEWADVTEGFLRDDATLAVVLVTDEIDCSVAAPAGYSFFTDINNTIYWNVNPDPDVMVPQATSAICFNSGVSCADENGDGIYEGCDPTDSEVLHPIERYISYFDYLTENQDKEVVMLGILGVPEVVAHNPNPPFQPIAGGAVDLLYRDWIDFPYPAGDIVPAEWESTDPQDDPPVRAANKVFEFGNLGPGCTGTDEMGNFTGQALPPVRERHVCESLNYVDEETGEPQIRCCIESICDTDFSPAIRCLTGVITDVIDDVG
jgi:hypothetical protein